MSAPNSELEQVFSFIRYLSVYRLVILFLLPFFHTFLSPVFPCPLVFCFLPILLPLFPVFPFVSSVSIMSTTLLWWRDRTPGTNSAPHCCRQLPWQQSGIDFILSSLYEDTFWVLMGRCPSLQFTIYNPSCVLQWQEMSVFVVCSMNCQKALT